MRRTMQMSSIALVAIGVLALPLTWGQSGYLVIAGILLGLCNLAVSLRDKSAWIVPAGTLIFTALMLYIWSRPNF
jgi:hypothetical protein